MEVVGAAAALANSATAATADFSAATINAVSAFGGAALSGLSSTMVMTGGDVGTSVKAAAIGGLGAGALGAVGSSFAAGSAARYAAHAAAGCVSAVLANDACGRGAVSQFASKYSSVNWDSSLLTASVVGGTTSVIGGGKFTNGAVTGAFA
jgi:hypothetical protein